MLMNTPTVLSPALSANDTRYPGTNFDLGAITVITAPTHGTITQGADGTLTYRPVNDFRGTDTFTYTLAAASPDIPASNTATVTITVISPIIAADDSYTVLMDTSTVLSPALSANDTTYPGTSIQLGAITVVTAPTHGQLSQTGGTLTYRPDTGYRGTDTFTYTVADTQGDIVSNPATVTLNVISPLIAADDSYTVLMDTSTVLFPTPTANDTTYPGTRLDLGAITVVTAPTHGMITQTGDTVTYRPFNGYRGT
ncbi:cadherin-like domain-containing protein, partial [Mycolicibacterium sp. CAU 1645]|nr:cadherin-like domain-containing protein [Mycolicibacterium sp. CAU 1645]